MKKILGIILLAVVVIVAGFSVWYLTPLSSVPVAKVLPADPLLYVQLSDMQKHWKEFQKSSFHDDIMKINLNPLVRNNPQLNAAIQSIKTFQDQLNTPDTQEYLSKFLGKQVTVVVYPRDPEQKGHVFRTTQSVLPISDFPDIFWISRVTSDLKWKELLLRAYSSKGSSEVNLEKVYYHGQLIYILPLADDIHVVFTRIGDLFVAALSELTIHKAIDVYQGRVMSLDQDQNFKASLRTITASMGSSVIVYWNTAKFFSMIAEFIYADQTVGADVDNALKNLQGFTVGGAAVSLRNDIKIKNEMYFQREQLAGDIKVYIDECDGRQLGSLFLAPKDVLWYQAVGCLNFNQYWKKIKTEMERIQKEEEPQSTLNVVESLQVKLGFNVEKDLLPALGSEIGWFANPGIQVVPMLGVKIPQVAVFLQINDYEKINKVLDALLRKSPIPPKREIVQGGQLFFLETPLSPVVEPSCMLVGDYLIVGINKDVIKESIYAMDNKKGALAANASFQKMMKSIDEKNQIGVFYFKLGELIERYSDLMDAGVRWVSAQNQAKQAQASTASASKEIDQKIIAATENLLEAQKRLSDLDDEIWNMDSQGVDTVAKKQQKQTLEEQIKTMKSSIRQMKAQKAEEEQKNISAPQLDEVTVVWRNILEPLMEAFKHVQAIGASSEILTDRFSTNIFIQMDK